MMKTKTFAVNGMKCEHCVANVENALRGVPGVHHATGNLATRSIAVEYDETTATPAMMKQAVENSGRYELEEGSL